MSSTTKIKCCEWHYQLEDWRWLTGNSLSTQVVHLGAGGDHSHRQLVDHENPPFNSDSLPRLRLLRWALVFDDLIHNFWQIKQLKSSWAVTFSRSTFQWHPNMITRCWYYCFAAVHCAWVTFFSTLCESSSLEEKSITSCYDSRNFPKIMQNIRFTRDFMDLQDSTIW